MSPPVPPIQSLWRQTGRRIAIVDDNGCPLGADEPGTLAIHRNEQGLMLGYHRPDAPARSATDR